MTTPKLKRAGLGSVFDMGMLYIGRTSGVLVAFIFLPLYNRELGPVQFGIVAVLLSMQALLAMLDMGMSVLVGRDFAMSHGDSSASHRLVRTAERALTGLYAILLVGSVLVKLMGAMPTVTALTVVGSIILFWVLVLQNLYYTGMVALRAYIVASSVQLVGVLGRAVATALALRASATVDSFVLTQLFCSIIHLAVTRVYLDKLLKRDQLEPIKAASPSRRDVFALLRRGQSLALFSLAGAAVTQLDKPIVSSVISAASVAPYFLATTVCMVPISVLAAPVSQYFQPLLLNAMGRTDPHNARRVTVWFTAVLLAVTLIPSVLFLLWRSELILLWLGPHGDTAVVGYVAILLPGFTIGALGFVPYSLLVSAKDFRFQASLSVALTVATLVAAAACAASASVTGVCFVYAAYHIVSTTISWLRASMISPTRSLARTSFVISACSVLLAGAVVGARAIT